jgi:uncharacterized protein (TIGR03435 family)
VKRTFAALALLICAQAFSQTPVKFEAASVKPVLDWPPPAGPNGQRGSGPGCPATMHVEPQRVDFRCTDLIMLIGYAYRIAPDRITAPDWMTAAGATRFDISATIPQGASKNQVPEMFQALLAERFRLVARRGPASLPIYALVVAKGGLKIRQATAPSTEEPDTTPGRDFSYGTVQSHTAGDITTITNPHMGTVKETGDPYQTQRWGAPDTSLEGLAELLDHVAPLSLPVIDMTGLSGRYQLTLEVSGRELRGAGQAGDDRKTEIEAAVLTAFNSGLQNLGLTLERRKGQVETVIVESAKKTPTAN